MVTRLIRVAMPWVAAAAFGISVWLMVQASRADPLLGLWTTDRSGGPFSQQICIPPDELENLIAIRNLRFTASVADRQHDSLLALLRDYGLEQSHLADVIHANGLGRDPKVPRAEFEIPLTNPENTDSTLCGPRGR